MAAIRSDRLMTLGLFSPLAKLGLGGSSTGRLPVLMYHSISQDTESSTPAYYKVTTRPDVFALHMKLLHDAGYQVVGIEKGLDLLRQHGVKTTKLVAITFDDGFRDFYTEALPILKQYGFGATMYIPTSFICDIPRSFKGKPCMSWEEVLESRKAGIEFGSHTVTHPKLYELDFAQIKSELEESKAEMEAKFGEAVTSFAYPYAFPGSDAGFVERFKTLLKTAGYTSNVTTRLGRVKPADCPYTLRRLPANSDDDAALFMAKINGSYDWLTIPQDLVKGIKGKLSPARRASQSPIPRSQDSRLEME